MTFNVNNNNMIKSDLHSTSGLEVTDLKRKKDFIECFF